MAYHDSIIITASGATTVFVGPFSIPSGNTPVRVVIVGTFPTGSDITIEEKVNNEFEDFLNGTTAQGEYTASAGHNFSGLSGATFRFKVTVADATTLNVNYGITY